MYFNLWRRIDRWACEKECRIVLLRAIIVDVDSNSSHSMSTVWVVLVKAHSRFDRKSFQVEWGRAFGLTFAIAEGKQVKSWMKVDWETVHSHYCNVRIPHEIPMHTNSSNLKTRITLRTMTNCKRRLWSNDVKYYLWIDCRNTAAFMGDSERCGCFMQLRPEISSCAQHSQSSSSMTSRRKSFVCINKWFAERLVSATVPFRNTASIHVNNNDLIYHAGIRNEERLLQRGRHTEAIKILVCKQKSIISPYRISPFFPHRLKKANIPYLETWAYGGLTKVYSDASNFDAKPAFFFGSRWVRPRWPFTTIAISRSDIKV